MARDDYNANTVIGREQVSSGYISAQLHLGPVKVTPGLRYEHVDVRNRCWIAGNQGVDRHVVASDGTRSTEHYGWSASDSIGNEFLPSLTAAWHPNARSVYRAAVWTSYTRPSFIQLAGNTSICRCRRQCEHLERQPQPQADRGAQSRCVGQLDDVVRDVPLGRRLLKASAQLHLQCRRQLQPL